MDSLARPRWRPYRSGDICGVREVSKAAGTNAEISDNSRDRGGELAVRRVLIGVVEPEGVASLDEAGLVWVSENV